jgi:hypothetical protein
MDKSSRHHAIAGRFGENLVLYWLSKYGFECAYIDHTGIDVIAVNKKSKERLGISVKSRTRDAKTAHTTVNIKQADLVKIDKACAAFSCKPYFAIIVDHSSTIQCFIVSKEHLLVLCPPGRRYISWKTTDNAVNRCKIDPKIKWLEFSTHTGCWW